jgi:hypothetical protein
MQRRGGDHRVVGYTAQARLNGRAVVEYPAEFVR